MFLGEILGEVLDHLMFLFSQGLQPCADYIAHAYKQLFVYIWSRFQSYLWMEVNSDASYSLLPESEVPPFYFIDRLTGF